MTRGTSGRAVARREVKGWGTIRSLNSPKSRVLAPAKSADPTDEASLSTFGRRSRLRRPPSSSASTTATKPRLWRSWSALRPKSTPSPSACCATETARCRGNRARTPSSAPTAAASARFTRRFVPRHLAAPPRGFDLSRNRYWYFFRRRRHATLSLDCQLGSENETTFAELIAADAPNPAQENTARNFPS